ncbi:MAG TPA: hypothetical protein VE127_05745 [Solirubrobacteraceae bacterium]|nr:hypothetical protein [Solirubrobacteraceae bacterium]
MHLAKRVPMLAAVVTVAAVTAPSAYGFAADAGPGPEHVTVGATPVVATPPVAHHSSDSTAWEIGAGAAGAVVVLGAGLTLGARSGRRRTSAAAAIRPAGQR